VAITLNEDGTIATLTIASGNETPGFGTRCAEDEAFINQFIGKKGPFTVGENVDALAGATVTSKAAVEALNTLFPAEEVKEEAAAELTAVAPGFLDSEVGVTVTLDAEGNIATLTIDNSKQVPPVCDMVDTDEFKNQFIGKKGPFVKGEGVDIVTGATFTSEGVIEALNSLFQ